MAGAFRIAELGEPDGGEEGELEELTAEKVWLDQTGG
jgi:hypothetical protein